MLRVETIKRNIASYFTRPRQGEILFADRFGSAVQIRTNDFRAIDSTLVIAETEFRE